MSTAIQFGERQLTIDLISQHLTTSILLPQVLREMVMDEILADSQIEIDRSELEPMCDRLVQAPMYQGFDLAQLIPIANRIIKLQKIKQAGWGNKVYSYFLQRKSALDGVVYSIIQVHDPEIAQELLFRVRSGEYSFAELAFKYSQSDEARDGGKINPRSVQEVNPELIKYIATLENGEVSPIFIFNNLYTFLRLEYFIPAQLDQKTSGFLLDELFDRWVQQKIAQKIGSLTPPVKLITPEFENSLLIESLDKSARIDSFDSEQRDWVSIELDPKPPKANIFPPEIVTNLKFQLQPDRVTRSSIYKLVHLAFWMLSLAAVSSIVSMNWEYFKLKSHPVDSTIDNTRFNRADLFIERRDLSN